MALFTLRQTILSFRRGLVSLRDVAGVQDPLMLYEPKFIDSREYPEYETINIRLQGPDYGCLEKYQGYVHRMAQKFKFNVADSYAVAAQTQKAVIYKPNSTAIENEMDLPTYDRVLRITNIPAPHLHLFISLIQTHVPVGVTITAKEHEKADEDYRYIPDILLKQKQEELKSLDNPVVRRNLGWE